MTPATTTFGDLEGAVRAARRAARVPAYAREWGLTGPVTEETFGQLPMLTKAALIAGVGAGDPFGGRLAVDRDQVHTVYVTPGPLYFPVSESDFESVTALQARSLASSGIRPDDIVDQTVGYQWVVGGTILHRALERIGCTIVPGGPGQTDLHVQTIAALGVTAILVFPSFLEHLLERADELGLALPLRLASIAGEMSDGDFKQRIERERGILVRERYGGAESGPIAYECAAGAGLHLDDSIYLEFIDPVTQEPRAIDDPELKEIVVTTPWRQAFPIIRLRTGDLVEALETERCACGSDSPRVRRIAGRASAIPRIKGMFVVPRQVEDALRGHAIDGRFQLRFDRPQTLDRLTIVFEHSAEVPIDLAALQADLAAVLRMRAELEPVESLASDAPVVDDRRDLR
jgi:phenylacetate-CoA ligase